MGPPDGEVEGPLGGPQVTSFALALRASLNAAMDGTWNPSARAVFAELEGKMGGLKALEAPFHGNGEPDGSAPSPEVEALLAAVPSNGGFAAVLVSELVDPEAVQVMLGQPPLAQIGEWFERATRKVAVELTVIDLDAGGEPAEGYRVFDQPLGTLECQPDSVQVTELVGSSYELSPGDHRLTVIHDLSHVLAGYDTSVAGEAALMCFFLAQRVNDRAVPIFVPMAIASGQIDWRIARQAIRRGARADWVSLQPFESLLGEPLAWVRERLRIEAPQRAHPRPSKSDLLMLEEHAV